ncbi:hypothetical protein HK104_001186, partial [Borealophlyctis nickersoniae]
GSPTMPAPKQTKKTNPPTTNQKPTSTNAAQASASTPTAPKPKKKTNEIDDIFGRKETLPAPAPTEEPAETKDDTPTPQPTLSKKQKKKLKDGNSGSDSTPVAATATAPNSAPKVETVEFKVPEIPVHRKRPREGDDDDDDGFADSRGTKGRRELFSPLFSMEGIGFWN